ncbi:DUF4362 domain-containing protein [Paenibacillus sp. CR_12]|uniref:DUF4362 domain-containing protein n=2 Tax=Paenibacillus TaxID=44249 RepID=UPI0035C22148
MGIMREYKLANRGTVLLWVMVLTMLLTGCGLGKDGDVKRSSETGERAITSGMEEDSQLQDYVTIHRGQGFGKVSSGIFGTLDSVKDVEVFDEAIRTAVRMQGIMDVREPDYDAVIHLDGESTSIHLWLEPDSKRGMFTYITDTGTGYTLTEQLTAQLTELIDQLRYTPEQAKKNGDVVFSLDGLIANREASLDGLIANREAWDQFVKQVEEKHPASVQLTLYTIEGSPIFHDLEHGYQGEFIRHRLDTTHDPLGKPVKSVEFCKELVAEQTEQGIEYRLNGCGEGRDQESDTFHMLFPVEEAIHNR